MVPFTKEFDEVRLEPFLREEKQEYHRISVRQCQSSKKTLICKYIVQGTLTLRKVLFPVYTELKKIEIVDCVTHFMS